MIVRLLNIQGIAGLVAGVALAVLLVLQKGETRHWKKQSAGFERLYRQSDAALAGTVANYRAAADAARAADQANAARVAADQRAINERTAHDSKLAWLTPALVLTGCASKPTAPQPIPALAEQRRCPAYPLPPEALLKAPVKIDFLKPMH
jgi:hypothetical protein